MASVSYSPLSSAHLVVLMTMIINVVYFSENLGFCSLKKTTCRGAVCFYGALLFGSRNVLL